MSETGTDAEATTLNSDLLGTASAAMGAIALGYVAHMLFESALLTGAVAVLVAAGNYLMVPYFLRLDEEDDRTGGGNFHPGAAGMALSGGAVIAIALMFLFEDAAIAVGAGVALAAAEYAVTSRILPHANR